MPELPEVHTTVEGLKKLVVGQRIKDVWSDFYVGTAHGQRQTIKNKKYFENFKEIAKGAKIKSVERRGKNILINLSHEVPAFFEQFSRVLVIVENEPEKQALAREHYRAYRAQGYDITTHKLQTIEL